MWQANEENIRGNQMEYIFRELIDINSHLFAGKRTNYTHNGVPGSPIPGLGATAADVSTFGLMTIDLLKSRKVKN